MQNFSDDYQQKPQQQLYYQPPSNNDVEHLNLLSVFYYIFAGLTAFGSLFSLIYVALGVAIASGAMEDMNNGNPGEAPPEVMGWFLVGIGLTIFIFSVSIVIAMVIVGNGLRSQTRYTLSCIVAGLICLQIPLGTALGITTFIILFRPSVKALYESKKYG